MSTEEFPPRPRIRTTVPAAPPDEEIAAVRDISFPMAMRGYDREAVDTYVRRVNRIIAELEVSRSPQSAIRHALEQVSEETRGLLERAHETAEEITGRSRARADDRVQQAEAEARDLRAAADADAHHMRTAAEADAREMRATAEADAHELRASAEARVEELEADLTELWHERDRVLADVREIAAQLVALAESAAQRMPTPGAEEEDQHVEAEAELEAELEGPPTQVHGERLDGADVPQPAGEQLDPAQPPPAAEQLDPADDAGLEEEAPEPETADLTPEPPPPPPPPPPPR